MPIKAVALMNKRYRSMTEGPLLPNIISYTIPIILTSILQLLFNAADLVVVGRFCGSISVAAVGATGAITNLVITLFMGLSVGVGVCIAHAIGAKEDQAVYRTVHTVLPTSLVVGIFLTVIGVVFSDSMLRMMDTPENVLPLSSLYMRIYFGGMTFNMVYNFCSSILRAAGDTKSPLIYLTLAGVINVLLNLLFVTVLHMNVAGVALATTISQGVSAVLVVLELMRRTDACRLSLKEMRFYKPHLVKMIRIGLPAGIQGSLFAISNVMIQSSINSFGETVMSGNAAAGNIEGFVYVAMNSLYQTAVNFVGQNVGAHQYARAKKTLYLCLCCAAVVGISTSMLAYSFAPQLLSIYITDSADAISYGVLRMSVVCFTYCLCGLMDTTTGALRGMGASLMPMIISVLGVCGVRMGWILTIFQLPQFHTPWWLYISYPISWTLTFSLQFLAFILVYRRRARTDSQSVLPIPDAKGQQS